MKSYKLNMTRPEFLKKFLTDSDDISDITMADMERIIPGCSNLIYVCYSCIMECDLDKSDITYVNCDGESVVIRLANKQLVKQVKAACHKERYRLGMNWFTAKVKTDGTYVFISIDPDHSAEE